MMHPGFSSKMPHLVASKSAIDAYSRPFPESHIGIFHQRPVNSPDLISVESLWALDSSSKGKCYWVQDLQ
jgi:hypothetical protein